MLKVAAGDGRANSKVVVGVDTPIIRDEELSGFSQPGVNFNQHWSCHHRAALAVTPVFAFNLGLADWSRGEVRDGWSSGGGRRGWAGWQQKTLTSASPEKNIELMHLVDPKLGNLTKQRAFPKGRQRDKTTPVLPFPACNWFFWWRRSSWSVGCLGFLLGPIKSCDDTCLFGGLVPAYRCNTHTHTEAISHFYDKVDGFKRPLHTAVKSDLKPFWLERARRLLTAMSRDVRGEAVYVISHIPPIRCVASELYEAP